MKTNLLQIFAVGSICAVIVAAGWVLDRLLVWGSDPGAPGLPESPPSLRDHQQLQCSSIVSASVEMRMCLHPHLRDKSCRCSLEIWNPSSEDLVFSGPSPLWPYLQRRVAAGTASEWRSDGCIEGSIDEDLVKRCDIYGFGPYSLAVTVPISELP